jgi:DNA-binding transcriptional ArsR family regulator
MISYIKNMSTLEAPFQLSPEPTGSELLAKYFRALGEPTRLRIIELLSKEELSVGEIVERLSLPQPTVSNHLACLRWCGFVANHREHRTVHYRLGDERVMQAVELARGLLNDNREPIADYGRIDGAEG